MRYNTKKEIASINRGVYILALVMLVIGSIALMGISWFLIQSINEYLETADKYKRICEEELNSTFERSIFTGKCYSVDEDGYLFYWKFSKEGEFYKIRP